MTWSRSGHPKSALIDWLTSRSSRRRFAPRLSGRSVRRMQATRLERAILDWIAGRETSLAGRLASASVARREHTGAGIYVDLLPDPDLSWDRPPVSGPVIDSPRLGFGGGCVLWLSQGEPCCLEIYAFGSDFPEDVDEFTLSSSDGSA